MRFKQKCAICQKAAIEGGSEITANIFTQYRTFIKIIKMKGWHVLIMDDGGTKFICPFCNRRMLKALEQKITKEGC